MGDLAVLAAGLDRLLESERWTAWPPSSGVWVPDAPIDVVDLAVTVLADADADYEVHDLTAAWLFRPDAKTEVQITWDGRCISFATSVLMAPLRN